jgi:hypothetical protein
VDPVLDPLLLRKFDGAGNRTRNLWICSQEETNKANIIKNVGMEYERPRERKEENN